MLMRMPRAHMRTSQLAATGGEGDTWHAQLQQPGQHSAESQRGARDSAEWQRAGTRLGARAG